WRAWPRRHEGGAEGRPRPWLLGAQACAPGLEAVDREQQGEGRDECHRGDGGGSRVVVLLELGDDEERSDLRLHRHVSGDGDDRSVFAEGAGEGEREAGEPGGEERGQHYSEERLRPARAAAARP